MALPSLKKRTCCKRILKGSEPRLWYCHFFCYFFSGLGSFVLAQSPGVLNRRNYQLCLVQAKVILLFRPRQSKGTSLLKGSEAGWGNLAENLNKGFKNISVCSAARCVHVIGKRWQKYFIKCVQLRANKNNTQLKQKQS